MVVSMCLKEDRLNSFKNFPDSLLSATHEEPPNAGFFYLGVGDRVKLFACLGGLQNWEVTDNPFVEHAKYYPNCPFLLQVKGARYIRCIWNLFPSIPRPLQLRPLGAQLAVLRALKDTPRPLNTNLVHIEASITKIECKICFDCEANIIFTPCGHISTCGNCASQLKKCPICRKEVVDMIQSYVA